MSPHPARLMTVSLKAPRPRGRFMSLKQIVYGFLIGWDVICTHAGDERRSRCCWRKCDICRAIYQGRQTRSPFQNAPPHEEIMKKVWRPYTNCLPTKMKFVRLSTSQQTKFALHIDSLMPGNQSFNQPLYAPLTRLPLACRPAVHFKRKVYMNRR